MRGLRGSLILTVTVLVACGGPASSGAASPDATIAPIRTPAPADIVDAFLRTTADPERSYAMKLTGDLTAAVAGTNVDIEAVVDGSSFRMTNVVPGYVMETVSVGGTTWTRLNEGSWSRGGSVGVPDPFVGLGPADLTYVGPASGSHRLLVTDPMDVLDGIWDGMFTEMRNATSTYEVLVGDTGVPVSAEIKVAGTVPGPLSTFEVNLHYDFTRWGEVFGIQLPPEVIPTPTPSPFVPPAGRVPDAALAGRLVLSSWWGGPSQALVVINLDGSNGKAWGTPSAERNYERAQSAFSPDGRLVAFSRVACELAKPGEVCPRVIATIDADGTQRDLTTPVAGSQDDNPSWAPDGKRIVFDSSRGVPDDGSSGRNLFVVDAAGGKPAQVATGLAIARLPDWSPDGTRIAFLGAADTFDGRGVYVVAATGGTATQVAEGVSNSRLRWSPDGSRIGWSRFDWNGRERLVTMRADGTDLTELIEGYFQAWSPNGEVILFLPPAGAGDENGIWVVRSDGAGARRLPFDEKARPSGLDWTR